MVKSFHFSGHWHTALTLLWAPCDAFLDQQNKPHWMAFSDSCIWNTAHGTLQSYGFSFNETKGSHALVKTVPQMKKTVGSEFIGLCRRAEDTKSGVYHHLGQILEGTIPITVTRHSLVPKVGQSRAEPCMETPFRSVNDHRSSDQACPRPFLVQKVSMFVVLMSLGVLSLNLKVEVKNEYEIYWAVRINTKVLIKHLY